VPHVESASDQVPYQHVEALVARQDRALERGLARQALAEVVGNMEVERVLALALDVERHETLAEPQGILEELLRHRFLRGAEEEQYAHPRRDGFQVDLADILVIDEQQSFAQGTPLRDRAPPTRRHAA
jgi:hypothetical protein